MKKKRIIAIAFIATVGLCSYTIGGGGAAAADPILTKGAYINDPAYPDTKVYSCPHSNATSACRHPSR